MIALIELKEYPVNRVLGLLLRDKTTKKSIIFATDEYGTDVSEQMTTDVLLGLDPLVIQPRVCKSLDEQSQRTRKKAEVFTPSWICDKMNNYCDDEWFGRENVFNIETEQGRRATSGKIDFGDKSWKDYVRSRSLEITCGEAPYIVSRYDAATGEIIEIPQRIGILDRKLRVVNENAADEAEWLEWVYKAYQSVYGYEYQGDNLLIARINLLMTFVEYMRDRWDRIPTDAELKKLTTVICWNFWQMNGISGTVPHGKPKDKFHQISLLDFTENKDTYEEEDIECRIYNWRANHSTAYKNLKEGHKSMRFDFVIGNPPYQDETSGDNATFAPPVYNRFMEAAYEVADKVELITPARFLFNAGSTPKQWNKKMLNDEHLKVLYYEQDSSRIFSNTDIRGGGMRNI